MNQNLIQCPGPDNRILWTKYCKLRCAGPDKVTRGCPKRALSRHALTETKFSLLSNKIKI